MISEKAKKTLEIAQRCAKDGQEIKAGAVFDEITPAEEHRFINIWTLAPFVCHGRYADGLLFDALDGKYYLKVSEGWAAEGNRLYALKVDIIYKFKTPVTIEEMEKMASAPIEVTGTVPVMRAAADRSRLRKIAAALRKEREEA